LENQDLPQPLPEKTLFPGLPPRGSFWRFRPLAAPGKSMGFPTKNDQHLGCEMGGVPLFKETPIP